MRPTLARTLALAFMLVLCVAFAGPAGAALKRPTCKLKGSKTIAQNSFARLYERGRNLYGCRRSSGRRVRLATRTDGVDLDSYTISAYSNVRLAGRFVAWASSVTDVSCKAACPPGYDGTQSSVEVFDMRRRRGRRVAVEPNGAREVAVSGTGRVAWATR